VIDCAIYPVRIAHTISLPEVTKHVVYSGFPFPPVPYAVMVNQAKWGGLADDLKAAIRAAAADLEKASFDLSKDETDAAEAEARLKAQGVTFHPAFSRADQDAIRKAALGSWETLAREGGDDAVRNRERVVRALGLN
jgi:TRAP-type C4-dicarboxylate transport system substrate-binding protein